MLQADRVMMPVLKQLLLSMWYTENVHINKQAQAAEMEGKDGNAF